MNFFHISFINLIRGTYVALCIAPGCTALYPDHICLMQRNDM